ncbi:MAG: diacylglycerol kinase family protein [Bacteroidales bacterium]
MDDFEPSVHRKYCCLKTFQYAWKGIQYLFRTQPNARIHLSIFFIAIVLGFFLSISRMEWLALLLVAALVLVAEGINTAIEILGDEIADGKWKNLVGRAKDVSAGAVLLAAVFSVIIGMVIFIPHIIQFFVHL